MALDPRPAGPLAGSLGRKPGLRQRPVRPSWSRSRGPTNRGPAGERSSPSCSRTASSKAVIRCSRVASGMVVLLFFFSIVDHFGLRNNGFPHVGSVEEGEVEEHVLMR